MPGTPAWRPPGPALLFCPADRPERYSKALDRSDAVILDLEDAVAPENRESARASLRSAAAGLDSDRYLVRLNAVDTPDFVADAAAAREMGASAVMLAKTESGDDVRRAAAESGAAVLALVETPLGVVRAAEIAAAPGCAGMMWGAEDLVAAMGGATSRFQPEEAELGRRVDGYRDVPRHARSAVALAAAAFDRFAVDSVHLDIGDVSGLRAEAVDAVALGYAATACIHPSQVEVIRAAYAPPAAEIAWAEKVLASAESEGGVFRLDGRMVDGPVIAQARATMRRAGASSGAGGNGGNGGTHDTGGTGAAAAPGETN